MVAGQRGGVPVRVLVVDSDDTLREMLGQALSGMGLSVDCVGGLAAARALLTQRAYRLCLTDLRLNDGDGLDLVRLAREHYPGSPVVVLTASASMERAVAALRAGATDCLAKPVSLDELRALLGSTLDIALPLRIRSAAVPVGVLVGEVPAMLALREGLATYAASRLPLVIRGEVGSGREFYARLIHASSARAERGFVVVDGAAGLTADELFGALEGEAQRDGLLHAAEGGTLFLKEVDLLSAALQVRLARVLREGRLRRLGAAFDEAIDVRVIACCGHALGAARGVTEALRHRLDLLEVSMPPLRERGEDVPLLVAHLMARLGEAAGFAAAGLTDAAVARLMAYSFPGNVRELEMILERSLAMARAEVLDAQDLCLPEALGEAA